MSVNVKNRPKIDFEQWTKEIDPEPKTLEECLYEAGYFPFVAKAIVPRGEAPSDERVIPAGTEIQLTERLDGSHMRSPDYPANRIVSTVRRWTLVGHRT